MVGAVPIVYRENVEEKQRYWLPMAQNCSQPDGLIQISGIDFAAAVEQNPRQANRPLSKPTME